MLLKARISTVLNGFRLSRKLTAIQVSSIGVDAARCTVSKTAVRVTEYEF